MSSFISIPHLELFSFQTSISSSFFVTIGYLTLVNWPVGHWPSALANWRIDLRRWRMSCWQNNLWVKRPQFIYYLLLAVFQTSNVHKCIVYPITKCPYVVIYECTCIPYVYPLAMSRSVSDLKHALFKRTWDNIFYLVTMLNISLILYSKMKRRKKPSKLKFT